MHLEKVETEIGSMTIPPNERITISHGTANVVADDNANDTELRRKT